MLVELMTRNLEEMNHFEMEEECMELEDAYAEALKDNAGFDALNKIWKRIQELKLHFEQNNFPAL
jgi:hypothetical protein